jgi:hypothetical protein
VKAGHRIVLLNLQCRQPSVFFTPLNQLQYDMQITTAAHPEKSLTENLTVMGEIAGRSSKEIVSQTDVQRRMLLVEMDSPTMKAKRPPVQTLALPRMSSKSSCPPFESPSIKELIRRHCRSL